MPDPTRARLRVSWLHLLVMLGLALLLVGSLQGWPKQVKDVVAEGIGRSIVLLLGGGVLSIALWAEIRNRLGSLGRDGTKGGDPAFQPDVYWLYRQQKETANDLPERNPDLVYTIVELLTNPTKYRTRTVETVSLDQRRIRQRVSLEYILPEAMAESKADSVYVPILPARKGELVDGFTISDSGSTSLPDLSYNETVRLISVALRLLVFACANESGPKLSDSSSTAEALLLKVIARRGVIEESEVEQDIEHALEILPRSIGTDTTDRERLEKFVRALGSAYPIITVVSLDKVVDRRILIRYERTIISRPLARDFKDRLRLRLGLRPYQVAIPVELALLTDSYHLHVEGPSDQYLMEQYLWCRHCMQALSRRWIGTDDPVKDESGHSNCSHKDSGRAQQYYYRLRRKWGQNYAHLYMRDYVRSRLRDIDLLVRFGETPPGTLASAVVTSAAGAVLIGAVGRLISQSSAQAAGGIPALVLTVPAIAASWFGFVSDSESVLRTSLASRICLINAGVLSFLAAAAYLLRAPKVGGLNLLGIRDGIWIVLFVLAALNVVYVSSRYIVRSAYYYRLLQRGDPESGHGVR